MIGISTLVGIFVKKQYDEPQELWGSPNKVTGGYAGVLRNLPLQPARKGGKWREVQWYSNWDAFVKDQVVAMTPHPFSSDALKEANEAFTNWGITTIPEFEDYPGVAGGGAWTYGISNTSEHKEAAFEVLKFLLADEQLVKYYSIFGDISRFPLDSPSLREEVEPDPIFENVDYDILFAQEFAAPIARSEFENEINRNGIFVDLVKSDLDVNTFIRETEEKITSIVADLKGKK
ncbi:ABC-type glycerol-3-phosphate transport system substrate-binding protein [Lederbergia galactosidilyticus]|uniref:extracellular solute-binding protein n=1 Tax=Lederbergia galactosidilytica TaxID=217031 RepID=UPI001AE4CDAC|nr:extracellular solute-binding protein [Lederbergia galactosidilytica]MBP1913426.1 ABC-type glycerol-3-phosphate transport system substrate-binding protein [Lederbergia galactosidilytica]